MPEYIERGDLPKKKEREFFLDDDFNAGWNACLNAIASIPAADVRPVVKAHNTGNARIFSCSECGYGIEDIFLSNEEDYSTCPNFCPNCGAKMEES